MAKRKGNGKNGASAEPPAWWAAAQDELETKLGARFSSIEAKLVLLDMKIDALDRRVTRLEKRG